MSNNSPGRNLKLIFFVKTLIKLKHTKYNIGIKNKNFLITNMASFKLTSFLEVQEALCNPQLCQSLYEESDILMKDVLLTLHGKDHRRRRQSELKQFTRSATNDYERAYPYQKSANCQKDEDDKFDHYLF